MNIKPYIKRLILLLLVTGSALCIGRSNAFFYQNTVGKIISIDTSLDQDTMDHCTSPEKIFVQHIKIKLLNGERKGEVVDTLNHYSETSANNERYQLFDQVFVDLVNQNKTYITGAKRDWILLTCLAVFITLTILIGKRKGAMALLSIALNVIIVLIALPYMIKHNHWLVISIVCATLFSVTSFLCIHGWSKISFSGLLGTASSTLISVGIASITIACIHHNTLDYDQMEYLTTIPAEQVFMMEIIIGGLGAIIDIANTMNTVVRELCLQNTSLTPRELWKSGMDAGKDVMGTMTNVLFFVFLAGSIPQFVLWISNQVSVGEVLKYLLSLELARALIGGISVVLSIPISLYIAIAVQKGEYKWQ